MQTLAVLRKKRNSTFTKPVWVWFPRRENTTDQIWNKNALSLIFLKLGKLFAILYYKNSKYVIMYLFYLRTTNIVEVWDYLVNLRSRFYIIVVEEELDIEFHLNLIPTLIYTHFHKHTNWLMAIVPEGHKKKHLEKTNLHVNRKKQFDVKNYYQKGFSSYLKYYKFSWIYIFLDIFYSYLPISNLFYIWRINLNFKLLFFFFFFFFFIKNGPWRYKNVKILSRFMSWCFSSNSFR